jgi:uncharacterized membrane protein YecN with MAPEG domain
VVLENMLWLQGVVVLEFKLRHSYHLSHTPTLSALVTMQVAWTAILLKRLTVDDDRLTVPYSARG